MILGTSLYAREAGDRTSRSPDPFPWPRTGWEAVFLELSLSPPRPRGLSDALGPQGVRSGSVSELNAPEVKTRFLPDAWGAHARRFG